MYNPLAGSFKKLSLILSATVLAVSIIVLIGWIVDIPAFKSISSAWVSMKANTAFCFSLSAISILILNGKNEKEASFSKKTLWITSLLIVLIGFITLCEYLFKFNAGID